MMTAAVVAAMLMEASRIADAGCVCPDLTNVRVGDLKVSGATIKAQKWTVSNERIRVKLELTGVWATTTIDVLAMMVAEDEPTIDPHATAIANGKMLTATVESAENSVRAKWRPGDVATGNVTVELDWMVPRAGADEVVATKPRIAEFCIDAGTRKALAKAHGFHRVDLALSSDMATRLTLRIDREHERLPVSLCAKGVKQVGKHAFEIRGRKNLQDKAGTLPILFGASI
jgi:hypothetical protein